MPSSPGDRLPDETKAQLEAKYKADATKRQEATETVKERGPLQPLIDMVPDNFFGSASSNETCCRLCSSVY